MSRKAGSEPYVLSAEELRGLQMVLVEMLRELDRICKAHGIRYNLFGGTMLGAVRHKGFIPWDDDLDVAMTREEYIRFRDACRTDLDESRFFFQDHTTDPEYPWGYARIRRKDSVFVRLGQEHMRMKTGIFLDIFPVDAVPDNKLLRGLHCFYCFLLRKLLYAESGMVNGKNALLRGVYALMYRVPRRFTFRRLENLARWGMRRRTRYLRVMTFPLPRRRMYGMERAWFENVADIEFEGGVFPGIADWDGFLTYFYRDYMTIPPPEKRYWHPAAEFGLPADSDEKSRNTRQERPLVV